MMKKPPCSEITAFKNSDPGKKVGAIQFTDYCAIGIDVDIQIAISQFLSSVKIHQWAILKIKNYMLSIKKMYCQLYSNEQKYVLGHLLFELWNYFYICKSYNKYPFRFFLHPGDTVVVRAQERGPTF